MKPGIKAEKKILSKLEISRIPFSGSNWWLKSDGTNKHFRVEVKSTEKKSYSLKKEIWKKREGGSQEGEKFPLMFLDISGLELFIMNIETISSPEISRTI